ncbi:hypothetical protein BGW37DRAFT_486604 [Umbelopsis sp. PMI_123]|nr:hypothetical protein BGW37DRAFT_486604 [Umbelopsis sp. PMI_123]
MVQSLSQSCALPSLIQYGLSDKIIGGSLVTSNEIRNNYIECSPLSFIYRYTSTTFEVRDILHLESVYALLTIHDLPTPDRHQLAIERAIHGTIGSRLFIILVARDTQTQSPKLFMLDPCTLRCHIIFSSFNSKDLITSMTLSQEMRDQDNRPALENSKFVPFHLLSLGTESGALFMFRLCLSTLQTTSKVPCVMAQCKTRSVASIAIHVAQYGSSDASAYIFVGGFNGEIEVITYGRVSNNHDQSYGTQSTKVITTLWKNMAVTSLTIQILQGKPDVILVAGQDFRSSSEFSSIPQNPAATMLRLKLPALKSMEVWKEECADEINGTAESKDCGSSHIGSFRIYESKVDKKLKLCSVSSVKWKHESHSIVFREWNVSGEFDSVRKCRQQKIAIVPMFLDASVADSFDIYTIYTSIAELSKRKFDDTTGGGCDFSDIVRRLRQEFSKRSDKSSLSYAERRNKMGSPLIIDLLVEQDGYNDRYPIPHPVFEKYCDSLNGHSSTLGRSPSFSHALLYIILDTIGHRDFKAFAKNIHLSAPKLQLIMDCWAIDNFQIDKLNSMNIFTYVIPFPTPYIKAVKLQGSVSTALQLIEVNHIPLQDIADVDVLAAYLLNMEPRDAALALKMVEKKLGQVNRLQDELRNLVSHWFENANTKAMQAQLLYTPLDSKLEKEIIAYCSLTNSSTSNLNFLFSYYLNHYNYAPAIDVYHRLMKLDATSQAQQQRKVMIESVCELVPHIQKKLCEIPTNNHGNEQASPFSSVVFVQTSKSSDSETDQCIILKQLIRQTQLLNPSDPNSNPFSGPPKMVI